MGSVVVVQGSVALWHVESSDQGLNQCPLHWQANSYALHYQGSPSSLFSLAISSVN